VETLEARRAEPEVEEWAKSLRERYGDTKLIVARDKLDEVKVSFEKKNKGGGVGGGGREEMGTERAADEFVVVV